MFNEANLEVSMKVFGKADPKHIRSVADRIFDQWHALLLGKKRISILFWLSDGSDILDYDGNLDREIEWAYHMGCANKPHIKDGEDTAVNLHEKSTVYMKEPEKVSYRTVKSIVKAIKASGNERFPEAEIRVGIPFDIGPEFAISAFKYRRHPEICTGNGEGGKTFVNSYGNLSKDSYHYAGYPEGIPEGLPFGRFLGRQADIYMNDLGFDYIWLSNGVGFSASSWDPTGEIYDGNEFHTENFEKCKESVFSFWKNFRSECKERPIYTRGTNFSAGIDYAVDAVNLPDIYSAKLNIIPPPNSPWASINGNFGLEIMGHMTRNCILPGEDMMFRFYIHDPWWINSPWYDRYGSSPHDIYLPAAVARVDSEGRVHGANILNVFTLDNTFGDMPENCAAEVIPHLMQAEKDISDSMPPLVWVYPISEITKESNEEALRAIISRELFLTRAISNGLPLNTVVSSDNFIKHNKSIYKDSLIVTYVPRGGSEIEKELLEYADCGGKILFLGSIDSAGKAFLSRFGIAPEKYEDKTEVKIKGYPDSFADASAEKIILRHELSGKTLPEGNEITAEYKNAVWYLAPPELESLNYDTYSKVGIDDPEVYAHGSVYLRSILKRFGISISFDKPSAKTKNPIITVGKSNNAYIFTAFCPNTTVETRLKFPLGAPILDGYDARLENGEAVYHFPRCDHKEARVFVMQDRGVVGVSELPPVSIMYRRKIAVTGLSGATVRIFPETYAKSGFDYRIFDDENDYQNDSPLMGTHVSVPEGKDYFEIEDVSGMLVIAMPYKDGYFAK